MKRGVVAIAIDPDSGLVLGATRRNQFDQWGFPGGKVDPGEDGTTAIMREFREETGIELQYYPNLIACYPCLSPKDGDGIDYEVDVFLIVNPVDILAIQKRYKNDHFEEIEPGIKIGYVPYNEMLKGPFADFNIRALNSLLLNLSHRYF